MAYPRILISALRGGSGKTIVSLGMIASWQKRGMVIAPFKKGPDFIDAGWLALAAGRPCHNLDAFLVPAENILLSFTRHTLAADVAVIEGNRGLYDGIDLEGATSTSELAKLLKAPVVLVIDCTKSTRTVAAVVKGCIRFDPDVRICGVILNRIAGARHESILRQTVEHYCAVPVLGAIPRIKAEAFPERHMGLVPTPEHGRADTSVQKAADMAEQYLDLERLLGIAREAPRLVADEIPPGPPLTLTPPLDKGGQGGFRGIFKDAPPRIGVIRDAAFQFYYPENLEALEAAGAEVVTVSALTDQRLPSLDGLYIGGGFPETQAQALAENQGFREDVRRLAEDGLPVYAECGGLMYLGESLVLDGVTYPMAGVLPVVFGFSRRPEGHGYTIFEVEKPNPYFETGMRVRGHEFHYSKVLSWKGKPEDLAFRMVRGEGFDGRSDGLCYKKTLATYTHIHALGTPSWAEKMVEAAVLYQKK
ncbi:MAG: cobyrinate a,c-diamide synthase [Deltaproteobacteria bacterium]|nr:cobyrinate a,c-diamide synthase [Deltaproteobacteria bacterium]